MKNRKNGAFGDKSQKKYVTDNENRRRNKKYENRLKWIESKSSIHFNQVTRHFNKCIENNVCPFTNDGKLRPIE